MVIQNVHSFSTYIDQRWDCWTDPDCSVLLSCAPAFASPHHEKSKDKIPWRDHWMQAVYYPQVDHPQGNFNVWHIIVCLNCETKTFQSRTVATKGEPVSLVACHDEYSMWFDLILSNPEVPLPMPQPQPGLQMAMSRCLVSTPSPLSNESILAGVDLDKSTVPPVIPSMLLLCRG